MLIPYPFGREWIKDYRLTKGYQTFGQRLIPLRVFEKFVLDPDGRSRGLSNWHNIEAIKAHNKRKIKRLHLLHVDNAVVETDIQTNSRTDAISIYNFRMARKKVSTEIRAKVALFGEKAMEG